MSSKTHMFTSESVTEGHPDKLADQISDAVLDAILEQDPTARVACEALLTTGMVVVAGEVTTRAYVEIPDIVRRTLEQVGYTRASYGIGSHTCGVMTSIQSQSPDIAMGVDVGGAGDQGMMFGFACDETPELMPLPIMMAHKLARRLAAIRKDGTLEYLRPDGKTQVTVEYEDGKPIRIDKVVVSTQHQQNIPQSTIREDMIKYVVEPIVPRELIDKNTEIYVNPTGAFSVGGPQADTGLTGRKIIVDTYGGMAKHGGGCFSGKDATKVDRSASYMMRYVAKNIVAAGLARRCELQVAYAIGKAEPMGIMVDTWRTNTIPEEKIGELIQKYFDLTPKGIIDKLGLRKPIFKQTAAYGHFGRTDLNVSWEDLDMVDLLKKEAGI